ncbi:TonB-dependent receptor plug domain-containing protein [Serratia ureilytica]|nr:TonB-dependent receptor plug domain-containing protein [Serratia ureilytica]MBF4185815.1 TonB-dependent receptor plug domain-containing protein [Serratia ureilytica]MBF8442633.1 TonB-dependent receptor plug domain-containing protein [Serratia ureilytica]MBF8444962.1 TonB-dependent receptor plug domain-containing protein [Serratia ureilytica]
MKENAILRLNTLALFIFFLLTGKSAEDIESFSIGEINVLGTNSNDEDSDALADSYRSPIPSAYLGKDKVERFRGTRNTDIFNDITGVQMNNPANEAGALDLGIRGMQGNGRVPVVIDDSVQSTLTERGYQGSSDRAYIDMDLIRSVRVDKGPTIGSDTVGATGGRVEMRTINANDVIPQGHNFGINFNFGTYNNNRMPHEFGDSSKQLNYRLQREQKTTHFRNGFYSLAMGGKNDYGSVLLAYTERTTGNYFAGKNNATRYDNGNKFDQVTRPGQEVANTSNENVSFLAKVSADFSQYNKLLLTYRHHHQQAGEILSAYLTKNQNTNGEETQAQWSLGTANLDAFSATHSYKSPVHNWLNLKSTFFYTELQTEQHNGFLGSGSYGDLYWNSVRDRRVGINASNTSLFPALPVVGDLKAEYGFAMEQQLIGPRVTGRSSGSTNIDGNCRSNSLFMNLTIDPTHWVTVAVGLRKNIVNLHSNRQAEYTKNIFDDAEHGGGGPAARLTSPSSLTIPHCFIVNWLYIQSCCNNAFRFRIEENTNQQCITNPHTAGHSHHRRKIAPKPFKRPSPPSGRRSASTSLKRLRDNRGMEVERIPSGSLGLDIAIGRDLPVGRIAQIGFRRKTSSCLIIPFATDPGRSACRFSPRAPRLPARCRH